MTDGFALSCPIPDNAGDIIEIAHGGGGLLMHRLIDGIIRPGFGLSGDGGAHDGAVFKIGSGRLAFTTDSYVVRPLFFPGGDIGSLAVNGTVNDLAMCGAQPLYLSVGLILEEGLPIAHLQRIVASMRQAADATGVRLVTGDTKVVERGKGDGIYINTAGVGLVRSGIVLEPARVRPGDAVLLSGDIGRHGIAVMAAREGFGFEGDIASDCAPLSATVMRLIDAGIELRCLRDPTRGGLATTLVEIAQAGGVVIRIDESSIAISDPVRGACELLGLDPLYVANEGRFVAFVPQHEASTALAVLRGGPGGDGAAIIGRVEATGRTVLLDGLIGGTRALDMLSGEQLPRIC
ncbi:MAG TPA: hydrogenase expression/formation protein HypE [Acetobacteraceae bacterium]|nr:hydrogenase expression/formation protein HypE [Acetobacteraceae bacterium]